MRSVTFTVTKLGPVTDHGSDDFIKATVGWLVVPPSLKDMSRAARLRHKEYGDDYLKIDRARTELQRISAEARKAARCLRFAIRRGFSPIPDRRILRLGNGSAIRRTSAPAIRA